MVRSLGFLLLVAMASACTGLHEVRPGVFRSPQPSDDSLARAIDRHELKTVVCLRGMASASAPSQRAANGAGIAFWNVPMSATRLPSPETLLALWRIATDAERPLLLHCRAGVDRTGLACALLVLHDTGDLGLARGQLGLLPYGHLGVFGTQAMGEVLDRYAPHHGSLAFPDWVRDVYRKERAADATADVSARR